MQLSIDREVRAFIAQNFLFQDDAVIPDTESLLDAGLIDSMGILELVAFLESRFSIQVADDEIVPANMDSIGAIVTYVESKLAHAVA